jgi:flagellar protein FliS
MFSSSTATHEPSDDSPAVRQRLSPDVGVETGVTDASPHKLVAMLYDGFLEALAEARARMRSRRHRDARAAPSAAPCASSRKACAAASTCEAGGRWRRTWTPLRYVGLRLTQANLRNDESLLDECQRLVQPLRDAWMSRSPPGGRPRTR